MPEVEFAESLENAGDSIVYRHVIPRFLWKLQNRMGLGQEKKMIEAGATFDRICAKYIAAKREEIRSQGTDHDHSNKECEDLLTYFIKLDTSKYQLLNPNDEKFLRDTIVSLIVAVRDTTSSALTWFSGSSQKTLTWKPRFATRSQTYPKPRLVKRGHGRPSITKSF
ncbi:hypothetical protein Bca52824_012277 [Brassica carinata]|uniref:Uncharacterized protein n=1 Tax=Brassica carinata TaxID=52824 RepID=A0A8X7VW65_BRACI|nr:hypothetical protein Bca52824_012277 [Brassica carinata]